MTKTAMVNLGSALLLCWLALSLTVGATALGGLCGLAGLALVVYSILRSEARPTDSDAGSSRLSSSPPNDRAGIGMSEAIEIGPSAPAEMGWPAPANADHQPTYETSRTGETPEPDPGMLTEVESGTSVFGRTRPGFWSFPIASRNPVVALLLVTTLVAGFAGWAAWQSSRPSQGLQSLQRISGDSSSHDGLLSAISSCQQYRDDPESLFERLAILPDPIGRGEFQNFFRPRCVVRAPTFEGSYLAIVFNEFDADQRALSCQALMESRLRPYFDRVRKQTVETEFRFNGQLITTTYVPLRDLRFSELEFELFARC